MVVSTKGRSSLKIVSQTSDRLILKTRSGRRVVSVILLPIAVCLGVVAIALGIFSFYFLLTESDSLVQGVRSLFLGIAFTSVGIIAPIALLMEAVTSQTWDFDLHQNTLYRVRKRFWHTRQFDYSFQDIARIYVNRHGSGADTTYRIEIVLSSGKKLPLSVWNGAHLKGPETEMVNYIKTFLYR